MITDELREYASAYDHVFVSPSGNITWSKTTDYKSDDDDWQPANTFLVAIADRIDAAYDEAITSVMNDALYYANDKDMAELGWIRLPVDANNEYIRVGDRMQVCDTGIVFDVTLLRLINSGWVVNPVNFVPSDLRHYREPTVEDVLREFGDWYAHTKGGCDEDGIIAEYAAKLRLKESE